MSSCSYGLLLCEEVIEIKPVSSLMRTSFLWPCPCASHRRPPCCWRAAAAGSGADNYNAICSHTATPTKCLAGTREACVCAQIQAAQMGADGYTNRCQLETGRKKTRGSPQTTNRMTSFPLLLNMNMFNYFPFSDSYFLRLLHHWSVLFVGFQKSFDHIRWIYKKYKPTWECHFEDYLNYFVCS